MPTFDGMRSGWNPWRDLRSRDHLVLGWARLSGCLERIHDLGDGRRIVYIDHRCDRAERNALLGHALVHDERGLFDRETPNWLVQKEEALVRAEVARRLVPEAELREFVTQYAELEGVTARAVSEWFDVPIDVASLALDQLKIGF